MISNLRAEFSTNGSATQLRAILDFDAQHVGSAFTAFGNGNQYGVFPYSSVPVTLPWIDCDSSIFLQYVVQDLEHVGCVAVLEVGPILCDTLTTGVSNPALTLPLEVFYTADGAQIVIPDDAAELQLWTYDGKLLRAVSDVEPNTRIPLSGYTDMPGLYVIQVRTATHIYVGKVVGF
jgi:hypothetical protein